MPVVPRRYIAIRNGRSIIVFRFIFSLDTHSTIPHIKCIDEVAFFRECFAFHQSPVWLFAKFVITHKPRIYKLYWNENHHLSRICAGSRFHQSNNFAYDMWTFLRVKLLCSVPSWICFSKTIFGATLNTCQVLWKKIDFQRGGKQSFNHMTFELSKQAEQKIRLGLFKIQNNCSFAPTASTYTYHLMWNNRVFVLALSVFCLMDVSRAVVDIDVKPWHTIVFEFQQYPSNKECRFFRESHLLFISKFTFVLIFCLTNK